jgi:hypothetical protein
LESAAQPNPGEGKPLVNGASLTATGSVLPFGEEPSEENGASSFASNPDDAFLPYGVFAQGGSDRSADPLPQKIDEDVFIRAMKKDRINPLDAELSDNNKKVVVHELLPKDFIGNGALASLKIWERLDNGKETSKRDWRESLKDLSDSCKSQLLSMRDRTVLIAETFKDFDAQRCCNSYGGPDFTGGLLGCKNLTLEEFRALEPTKIVEWPICGTADNAVCGDDSIFPVPTSEKPIACARCELRINSGQSPGAEKAGKMANYDLKVAKESRITCRSASSARSAIATWCINQKSPLCEGLTLELTRDQAGKEHGHMDEIFARISPHLACSAVNSQGRAVGSSSMDSNISRVDYVTTSGAGGEFSAGFAFGLNLPVVSMGEKAKTSMSINASSASQLQVVSKGAHSIYTFRNGRIEFAPKTGIICSSASTEQSCNGDETIRSATFSLPGASPVAGSVTAEVKGNTTTCKSLGTQIATDQYGKLPEVAGLSLDQAIAICASQNRRNAKVDRDSEDLIGQAAKSLLARVTGSESVADWLPLIDKRPTGDRTIFNFDISRRNLYCAEANSKSPTKDGTHFLKLSLAVDDKGKFMLDLAIEGNISFRKNFNVPIHVPLDGDSDEPLITALLDPALSNATLLDMLKQLIAKFPKKAIIGSSLGDFAQQNCAFQDLPTQFILGEKPFACIAPSETSGVKNEWLINVVTAKIEDSQMKITAFSPDSAVQLVTRINIDRLGSWPTLLRQGVLTAGDAIKIFEVSYQLQNGGELNCLPSPS